MLIIILLIILLLFFLYCSAICSATETSLFSLSSMKVRAYEQDLDTRKKLIARLLSKPRDLLVTILIINIFMNLSVQNVISSLLGEFGSWTLKVLLPLIVTLIFGEILPKSIGLANNEEVAYRFSPFFARMVRLLHPLQILLNKASTFVSRYLFFFLHSEKEIAVHELQVALSRSHETGIVEKDEVELIRGLLRLEEARVKEIMRPREDILYYDIREPLERLLHLFVDQECTRVPVCDGGIENLIGVITSRWFFLSKDQIHSAEDLRPYLKKPYFVPELIDAVGLLSELYAAEETLAIAVDEYGSVSGLVTMEDLVEIVIGDIADRRDEKRLYTVAGENVIIASGKMEVAEVEELFGVELPNDENFVTIGGWLSHQMGEIPKSGTKVSSGDLFFHVLSSLPNRVRRIYIRKQKTGKK